MRGRVETRKGDRVLVADRNRALVPCAVRKKLPPLAVGDWVEWELTGEQEGVIHTLEPRRSLLARPDPFSKRKKPIAANIDQILVVLADPPGIDLLQLDRILIAAEAIEIPAVIVINKSDLLTTEAREMLEKQLACYTKMDYPLLWISVKTGDGLDALQQQMAQRSNVLVGASGVGKSSIIQQLLPNEEIAVGKLKSSGVGKHTTSVSTLYQLPNGGELIDSPGIREFGLWDLDESVVQQGFREMNQFVGQCKFHNCKHLDEPGCMVEQAAESEEIDAERLSRYRELLQLQQENGANQRK